MRAWLAAVAADIATLRASWRSVRGGWRMALSDARQLITHRRVLVDTSRMAEDRVQVVLRTRLRLIGDTQTDILRPWLVAASVKDLDEAVTTHFRAVTAAMDGWAVARGMERLLLLLAWFIGIVVSLATTVQAILVTPASALLHAVLVDWRLWAGLVFGLAAHLVRWILRLLLRAMFRRSMSASSASRA